MPIGEIAGEALGGVLRLVGRLLFECIFELFIQGTGRFLIRLVRPGSEPGEMACAAVGMLFWILVVAGGYFAYAATAGGAG